MPKGEGVCVSCGEYLWDCECKSKLVKYKSALVKALDALSEYGAHDGDCILSFWEAGQPTENGGYRTKIKGKWYQTRPVDETPKCGCGYDESMAELRKVLGK